MKQEILVPPSSGTAFEAKRGQIIRLTDVKGGQVADFVAFVARDKGEKLDQSRTRINNWKYRISTGDKIYTNRNNILFTILDDKVGIHDLTFPGCSSYVYEHLLKVGPRKGCIENLADSLRKWNIGWSEVPAPLSFFMEVEYSLKTNEPKINPAPSKPGDFVDLLVEKDSIVAISSCADDVTECNHGKCKPILVEIRD